MARRLPDHSYSVGTVVFGLLLLTSLANLIQAQQQQHLSAQDAYPAFRRNLQDGTQWSQANRFNDQEHSSWEPVNQRKNTHTSNFNDDKTRNPTNVRAVATTLAPAQETHPLVSGAVEIPSALKPPVPRSGRSASRLPARSLQNWEVEDIVLLATVDGTIHARDRRTGAARWALQAEDPMVKTIYHDRKGTTREKKSDGSDGIWIVEPSQDGSLYYYVPGSSGVQRLGVTVKQLEQDPSAYVAEEPSFTYTASRKSTIYEVDVRSGKIVKLFNTPDSAVLEQARCSRVGPFESPEDDSCVATGTIILVRVEYLVQVADSDTGETICTIKYLEWAPNSRDNDLHRQYHIAKDNRYIYSEHNGRARALDHHESVAKQGFIQDFGSPVARVFDVARSVNHTSTNTPLILLPQPDAPLPRPEEDVVFVNCTESGSWFALSQDQYPMIAHAPKPAGSLSDMENAFIGVQGPSDALLKSSLVGVHSLSTPESLEPLKPRFRLLDPPSTRLSIDAPAYDMEDNKSWSEMESKQTWSDRINLYKAIATIAIFVLTIAGVSRYRLQPSVRSVEDIPSSNEVHSIAMPKPQAEALVEKGDPQSREETPRLVTVEEPQTEESARNNDREQTPSSVDMSTSDRRDSIKDAEEDSLKKKKAHRGKRGGKAAKEKQQQQQQQKKKGRADGNVDHADAVDSIVEGVKKGGRDITIEPDVVPGSARVQESGPKGLQNLLIHTDRVLGNGSGGTFVFEGQFEGRHVAVKRMLPQFYELASQEVSLLESSEDHPNVIRYFCRREDEHFLYIALELCQASLWDLYRDGRRDEAPDEKFAPLSEEINRNPQKVLKQMAEGVNYLHSFRIVHRDIKPQNMLITYPKKNNLNAFPRLVISDFGLCKTLPENVSTLIGTTGHAGTAGWKAPELILQPKDSSNSQNSLDQDSNKLNGNSDNNASSNAGVKRAIDIFSLGCVFFYVLTRGQHPFDDEEGWMQLRERNIKTARANFAALELLGPDTVDLVRWMLSPRPEDRPTAAQVLAHPFFWDAEDRLEFLNAASNRFDDECRDPPSSILRALESHAEDVIPKVVTGTAATSYAASATHGHLRDNKMGATWHSQPHHYQNATQTMHLPIPEPNFLAALDRHFVDELGQRRKYHPGRLADLLRALRNKYTHFGDMSDEMKARVGPIPEGYLAYWEKRFPRLVVVVWRVGSDVGLGQERKFARWLGPGKS